MAVPVLARRIYYCAMPYRFLRDKQNESGPLGKSVISTAVAY